MHHSYLLLCIISCFLSAPTEAQENNFFLDGKTSGIEDGTYLYLRDLVNGGDIDSAMVKENRFRFETHLPEEKLYVMLHTRDRMHFKELWLEDRPMSLDATAGPFAAAKVTGSRDQELAESLKKEIQNEFSKADERLKQRKQEFITQNPNSLVSAYVLNGAARNWKQEEIAEYFSGLNKEIQNSTMGQRVKKYLEKDLPEVGEKYIDLSIPDQKGELKRISDLSSELTLLQFWSSTCRPSREMNTHLKDLYTIYAPKGLNIIGISDDAAKDRWQQAIAEDGLSWPQLCTLTGRDDQAFDVYGIKSTPSNFLIDSEGVIIDRNLRPKELADRLAELLEDKLD